MIIALIVILIVFTIIFIRLYTFGHFGIYEEFDAQRQCVYFWYKGRILNSFYFSEDIKLEQFKESVNLLRKESIEKIRKIKKVKEHFNKLKTL